MSLLTLTDLYRVAPRRFPFLTKKQSVVCFLALNEGLGNEEIATRMGCSYGDVALLLHRATKRVKANNNRQALAQIHLLGAVSNGMRDNVYAENLDLIPA